MWALHGQKKNLSKPRWKWRALWEMEKHPELRRGILERYAEDAKLNY